MRIKAFVRRPRNASPQITVCDAMNPAGDVVGYRYEWHDLPITRDKAISLATEYECPHLLEPNEFEVWVRQHTKFTKPIVDKLGAKLNALYGVDKWEIYEPYSRGSDNYCILYYEQTRKEFHGKDTAPYSLYERREPYRYTILTDEGNIIREGEAK